MTPEQSAREKAEKVAARKHAETLFGCGPAALDEARREALEEAVGVLGEYCCCGTNCHHIREYRDRIRALAAPTTREKEQKNG